MAVLWRQLRGLYHAETGHATDLARALHAGANRSDPQPESTDRRVALCMGLLVALRGQASPFRPLPSMLQSSRRARRLVMY